MKNMLKTVWKGLTIIFIVLWDEEIPQILGGALGVMLPLILGIFSSAWWLMLYIAYFLTWAYFVGKYEC
jgi:hypothetical protein